MCARVCVCEREREYERDFNTILSKTKQSGAELIYSPTYQDAGIALLSQASRVSPDIKILGANSWIDTNLQAKTPRNLSVYITESDNSNTDELNKLKDKFGDSPITTCAPQAYDAANILFSSINKVNYIDADKLADTLRKQSIKGVSGDISFDINGDVQQKSFKVEQIIDGKPVKIKSS